MDKQFHPTFYNGCNYLSMLGGSRVPEWTVIYLHLITFFRSIKVNNHLYLLHVIVSTKQHLQLNIFANSFEQILNNQWQITYMTHTSDADNQNASQNFFSNQIIENRPVICFLLFNRVFHMKQKLDPNYKAVSEMQCFQWTRRWCDWIGSINSVALTLFLPNLFNPYTTGNT